MGEEGGEAEGGQEARQVAGVPRGKRRQAEGMARWCKGMYSGCVPVGSGAPDVQIMPRWGRQVV